MKDGSRTTGETITVESDRLLLTHPTKPLSSANISKLVIGHAFRRDLKYILYKYGIHRAALFPGFDGLAKHIEWMKTDEY